MNLIITAYVLVILLLITYVRSKELLMSPVLVFTASFILGLGICIVNLEWEFDISLKTSIVIISENIAFNLGHFISEKIYIVNKRKFIFKGKGIKKNVHLVEKNGMFLAAVIISWIALIIYFVFIVSMGGLRIGMISRARSWMLYNAVPNIIGHMVFISQAIAMGYVYLFMKTKVETGILKIKYFFPIIAYILIQILSTSRSGLIYFFGYILVVVVSLNQLEINILISVVAIIRKIIKFGIIVLVLFLSLGVLTGKTEKLGVWNSIATYFGGSIYSFDWYIEHINQFTSPSWGYNCFPIITSVKSSLGMAVYQQDRYYFPFIEIPVNVSDNLQRVTNLYTCLNLPICDFGVGGSLCFFLLLGVFYGYVYKNMKKLKYEEDTIQPSVMYFGYVMMPIFCSGPAYSFGSFLFAPMSIYQLLYIFIFINLWFRKDFMDTRDVKSIEGENEFDYRKGTSVRCLSIDLQ